MYLDVRLVGQDHAAAIDTHAPATRRRQAVLERRAERLVNQHGLIVAGRLGLHAHRPAESSQ